MNIDKLKDYLYDVTASYFTKATVVWAGESNERPPFPFVYIRMSNIETTEFPADEYFNDRNEFIQEYVGTCIFEAKLYTKGHIEKQAGQATVTTNTALSDMTEFSKFMRSIRMHSLNAEHNVSMQLKGTVHDTSVVVDHKTEYSAMVEYDVSFMLEQKNAYGIAVETDSGGGSEELIQTEIGEFESVRFGGTYKY